MTVGPHRWTIVQSGGTAWTGGHHDWLRRQRFDSPALAAAYNSALEAVLLTADRRDRLDTAIVELASDPAWSPMVTRLSCLRWVSTLTAFGLAVEVGDWTRFTGNTIGAFLGLVPTERSSGASRSQGSITKAGNTQPAGCWSRPPGTTSSPTAPRRRRCGTAGRWPRRPRRPAATPATSGCANAGWRSRNARNGQ